MYGISRPGIPPSWSTFMALRQYTIIIIFFFSGGAKRVKALEGVLGRWLRVVESAFGVQVFDTR